jgi:hypothetical protein
MLTALAIIALIVVAAVLGYAATRPDTFRIQRTASIQAPAEKIFALINDFRNWSVWSPWEKIGPDAEENLRGPAEWPGRPLLMGRQQEGRQGSHGDPGHTAAAQDRDQAGFPEALRSPQHRRIHACAAGQRNHVTWVMHGPNLFVGKVMGRFFNMDRLVGKDFEAGLANLKTVAERQALAGS